MFIATPESYLIIIMLQTDVQTPTRAQQPADYPPDWTSPCGDDSKSLQPPLITHLQAVHYFFNCFVSKSIATKLNYLHPT